MDRREPAKRDVPHLAGRRLPGDHGLTSLGLIMQLGGSVFLACAPLEMAWILWKVPGYSGVPFSVSLASLSIVAAGAIRSAFHRAAGSALVHWSRRGQFRPALPLSST